MKGLGNSIKHPLFKYAMYTLAAINLYEYTTKKKYGIIIGKAGTTVDMQEKLNLK
jgi:hypothetical protein